MLRLLPLVLLLLAATASAQPSAADSALVDRFVEALRLDRAAALYTAAADSGEARFLREIAEIPEEEVSEAERAAVPALDFSAGAVGDPARLTAAVREAVFEDLRPALLREAVAGLESPPVRAVVDRLPAVPGLVDPERMARTIPPDERRPFLGALTEDSPPRDSALVAFVDATLAASYPDSLARLSVTLYRDLLPPEVAEATAGFGMPADGADDPELYEEARQFLSLFVIPVYGHRLREADVADVRAATAWYTSAAGTYAIQRAALAVVRLNAEQSAASMIQLYELLPPEE